MVHPGRFELPTARFVAEYSIQLSYGCKVVYYNLLFDAGEARQRMVHPGRFELPTARFVAEYSIQLSYGCILILTADFTQPFFPTALAFASAHHAHLIANQHTFWKVWCTQEDSNFRPLGS